MNARSLVVAFVLAIAVSQNAFAQTEWSTLSAKFVYDGEAPKLEKLSLNKDIEVCIKKHPVSEDLVVHAQNKGIQNVVVYLELKASQKLPAPHPDDAKAATEKIRIDNQFCRFEPHIAVVRTGRPVILGNEDPIAHSVLANLVFNAPFNVSIQGEGSLEYTFERPERRPCDLTCPIHSWIKGFVVVKDHPYVGVSNKDGLLEIKNIPTGKWTFQFWHERPGYVKRLALKNQTIEDRKGLYELEILAGKNDLGTINMSAVDFVE